MIKWQSECRAENVFINRIKRNGKELAINQTGKADCMAFSTTVKESAAEQENAERKKEPEKFRSINDYSLFLF